MVGPRFGIPTPAGTPFEAIGEYPSGAWFHGVMFIATQRKVHPTDGETILSIAFPLLMALAALVITQLVLTRRSPS
ncbi:hypothetical protein [Actinacidiphila oryziradicis]|uniref:Uncharacterized protein n=1 Tax=Actinacidiphila oryziradicis TaxID=2571141 RepID=A0A4V5N253_9ACTN|nr:hypothetical protein [Actinacidiphila oryziradicis]TKA08559.1 hypothetical protein FCI23_26835 [Actinacidiphila oryziradicis]